MFNSRERGSRHSEDEGLDQKIRRIEEEIKNLESTIQRALRAFETDKHKTLKLMRTCNLSIEGMIYQLPSDKRQRLKKEHQRVMDEYHRLMKKMLPFVKLPEEYRHHY